VLYTGRTKKKQGRKIAHWSRVKKKEDQRSPPQPVTLTPTPLGATRTVNESAFILGSSLILVFVFLFIVFACRMFLQAKWTYNYPITVHEHSNRVIVFGLVTVHGNSNQPGLDYQPTYRAGLSPAQYEIVCILLGWSWPNLFFGLGLAR